MIYLSEICKTIFVPFSPITCSYKRQIREVSLLPCCARDKLFQVICQNFAFNPFPVLAYQQIDPHDINTYLHKKL